MQHYLHYQSQGQGREQQIEQFSVGTDAQMKEMHSLHNLDPATSLPRGPYNQDLQPLYGNEHQSNHQHETNLHLSTNTAGRINSLQDQTMSEWNHGLISNGNSNSNWWDNETHDQEQEPERAVCVGQNFQPITAPNAPYTTSLRPTNDAMLLSPTMHSSSTLMPLGADSFPCGMGNGIGQTQSLTPQEIQARSQTSHAHAVQNYMRSLDDERNPANDFIPFTRQWSS